jgi:hypothetical protein
MVGVALRLICGCLMDDVVVGVAAVLFMLPERDVCACWYRTMQVLPLQLSRFW